MPVDVTNLIAALNAIPHARAQRLVNDCVDRAMDIAKVMMLEQVLVELQRTPKAAPQPVERKGGKRMSTVEARLYIQCGATRFGELLAADLIRPENMDATHGERHWFSKAHLDNFLAMPSGEVRKRVAEWKRDKVKLKKVG